jgi:hypothetical protein
MDVAQARSTPEPGEPFEGCRVIILLGDHRGEEGVCLGIAPTGKKWAISPDSTDEVLHLEFEKEFGLLIDLSADPAKS